MLISKNADRAPYGALPDISQCYYKQTRAAPVRYGTTQGKNSSKSSGARAILKFACYLQIGKIVRRQFFVRIAVLGVSSL